MDIQTEYFKRQELAALLTGYRAIALRRVGDYAVVEIERGGHWYEVIREALDGQFSHIVEPLGIENILTDAGVMGLKAKEA